MYIHPLKLKVGPILFLLYPQIQQIPKLFAPLIHQLHKIYLIKAPIITELYYVHDYLQCSLITQHNIYSNANVYQW